MRWAVMSAFVSEGYPWIGCECCKGTVWAPFKMLRERLLIAQRHGARPSRLQDEMRSVR